MEMKRPARSRFLIRLTLAAIAWPMLAHAAFAASEAEFAIRWDPSDGGPRTIEEIGKLLQIWDGKRKHKDFIVRYFSITQPTGLPEGASAIARERTLRGKTEAMFKIRGTSPFPTRGPLADFKCPFSINTEHKNEVDIGWTPDGLPKKIYSFSCDTDGYIGKLLPARFEAKAIGCESRVRRVEAHDIKIERWNLPAGEIAFEVSWNGQDTAADLERFTSLVVRPLKAHGVKALAESKTQLGSTC